MKKIDQKEIRSKSISVIYSTRGGTYDYHTGRKREHLLPKIQMEGKWLEKLGFHYGDKLKVEYCEGMLQITLAEPNVQPLMAAESDAYMVAAGQA